MSRNELVERLYSLIADVEYLTAGYQNEDSALRTDDAEWLTEVREELESMAEDYK